MTKEELIKEAENFIIQKYELDKCYRADTKETRQYMSIDVHNDYEEEYQCYLAGAEPREKKIIGLEKENLCLKSELSVSNKNCNYWKITTGNLNKEIIELKSNIEYAKAVIRELLDNATEYSKQIAEDFIAK